MKYLPCLIEEWTIAGYPVILCQSKSKVNVSSIVNLNFWVMGKYHVFKGRLPYLIFMVGKNFFSSLDYRHKICLQYKSG